MTISSRIFARTTISLLVVGLLALLAIVAATLWLGARSQAYFDEVLQARDSRTAAVDLRNSVQTAETSQRGFLLTGDLSYLVPYAASKGGWRAHFEMMQRVLAGNPELGPSIARVGTTIDEKFAEMDETIQLKREGRDAEALEIVATDRGKALMDEAHAFFARIIRDADLRVAEGVAEQRGNAALFRWVSIVGALVIVLVVGGSALAVWRYTREIIASRAAMDELNAGLEARVEERTADLAQANEEIQRFAYIVTHDLRAPLVNIMGFTSELEASVGSVQAAFEAAPAMSAENAGLSDPVTDDARRAALEDLPEAIGFIRSSTKRMDGLINAILKLSREGRRMLKPERVELGELLRRTSESIHHQLAESEGEVSLELDVPAIQSDRLSLEQIFGNLLDNAVKYRAKDRPLRIVIRGRTAPENRVVVEVEDNGRGIAPQDLERVFELFRRSGSQDQPGEGIGLAHVRTLARSLGGNVTVKSALGKGTTFVVNLPRNLPRPSGSTAK